MRLEEKRGQSNRKGYGIMVMKTGEDRTRQDTTRQDKTKPNKTNEMKSTKSEIKQYRTGQNRTNKIGKYRRTDSYKQPKKLTKIMC